MDDSLTTSLPLAVPRADRRSLEGRLVFLIASCAAVFMLVVNLFHRESYSGDEGFYGVTAANMLQSPAYIIRPSYFPGGDFLTDRDGFAHPPFNSYFYALSLWLARGSLVGPEVLNALSLVLLLYFGYRLVSLFDLRAARFTTLLLAASPAIILSWSQLEAEPLMTTFGIMALYFALKAGIARGQRPALFVAGLCLGFSYALKLWLCGPLALAVAVALILRARRCGGGLRQNSLALLIFGAGALIPAGLHLLVIWRAHPEDLGFWLKNIYFGLFTSSGISGSKLGGLDAPAAWVHPFWYYGAAIYRDHFFLLPIILLGFGSALRDSRIKRDLLWIMAAGLFGLLPLSLMKVKEPLYVLSCVIFIYFLAGICLAALARRIGSGEELDRFSASIAPAAILGLLLLFPLAWLRGLQPGKITGGFVVAHSIILTLVLGVFLWSRRRRTASLFAWPVYGACALAVLTAFGYDCFSRRPRDKFIADLVRPLVHGNSSNTLSIIASNFKCYQYYCYHRGCYWEELPLQEGPEAVLTKPGFTSVQAFILDSDDQRKPEIAPWLAWLQTHAREKTGELDAKLGRVSGFRVFVKEGAQPGA